MNEVFPTLSGLNTLVLLQWDIENVGSVGSGLVASLSISLAGENGPLWTIIGLESENSGPGKGDQREEDRDRQNALQKHIMSHLVLLGLRQPEVVGQSCRQVLNLLRTSVDIFVCHWADQEDADENGDIDDKSAVLTKKDDQRNLVPTVGGKRQRL